MTTVPNPPLCECGCGEPAPKRRKWIPGHRVLLTSLACSHPECDRKQSAAGLCNAHYKRSRKQVQVPMDVPVRAWGTSTYRGIHEKLRYRKGPASMYLCSECGDPARVWAFDNFEPKVMDPETGSYFYDDFDRYRPMCDSCHLTYDRGWVRCPHDKDFFEGGRCRECARIDARDRYRKRETPRPKKPMSPEKRVEMNRQRRERYANDPEYRERAKENARNGTRKNREHELPPPE